MRVGGRIAWLAAAALLAAACHASSPSPTTPLERTQPAFDRLARPPLVDRPTTVPTTTVVTTEAADFVVYPRPSAGQPAALVSTNDWGQPLALPVLDRARADAARWYRVRLPVRPNGATGWVRARDVTTRSVDERIVVDLSDHLLRRFHGGDVIDRFLVGVGTSTYPTTPGRFFVWARLRYDPPSVYGVGALGLSGFSEVITDWAGGGRMAIHGTEDPSNRGHDVSHGCVRVYDPQMALLADVPMGTPVWIHP